MQWLQGPISDQEIFWLGIKVFWWKRAVSIAQIVAGSSALLALVSKGRKERLHAVFAEASQHSKSVIVPRVIRLSEIAGWAALVISVLACLVASLCTVFVNPGHHVLSWFPAFLITAFYLLILTIPVASLIVSASIVFSATRVARRFGPPTLSWLTDHKRIEFVFVMVPYLVFIIASAIGLYLS